MKKGKMKKTVLAIFLAGFSAVIFANEKGDEIMKKVHDVEEPSFNRSAVVMVLYKKGGAIEETRNVLEYGKSDEKSTAVVMDFKTPPTIAGTRFLQEKIKNSNQENKFLYLPALKQTRRVSSSEGSKSFMGTDATFDDMTTRKLDEDTHEFLLEEPKIVGGTTYPKCYVIEEIPIDAKSSQYSKKIVWIDDTTMYPIYTELYDKKGKLLKILSVEKIKKISGSLGKSYDVPIFNTLENVQTGHKTTLEVKQCEVDKEIPARVFTQQFLATGK